jgi:hypothetical protein
MKVSLSTAGLVMVLVFANASFSSGMLETPQARGSALDGLKTGLGMPYSNDRSKVPIRFQAVTLQCHKLVIASPHPSTPHMTLAPPEPPEPPTPSAPPEILGKVTEHGAHLVALAHRQDACF